MNNIKIFSGSGYSWICIVLIIMKSLGYIDWSWWWIFSPIWIPIALVISIAIIFFTLLGLAYLFVWLYFVIKDLIERFLEPWRK